MRARSLVLRCMWNSNQCLTCELRLPVTFLTTVLLESRQVKQVSSGKPVLYRGFAMGSAHTVSANVQRVRALSCARACFFDMNTSDHASPQAKVIFSFGAQHGARPEKAAGVRAQPAHLTNLSPIGHFNRFRSA